MVEAMTGDGPQSFLCAISEMVRNPEQIWIFDFDSRLYRWDPAQCLLLRLEEIQTDPTRDTLDWVECRTEFNVLMSSNWSRLKENS